MDPRFEFYAITDQASARGRSDLEVAKGLIEGGCSCLQYRAKKVHARKQWEDAAALAGLCRRAGIPFIVNDRVDLALDCGADGVHIGQDDLPIAAARRLAGSRLFVGRSSHSLAEAVQAQEEGADYVAFGPVYATATKENNVAARGLDELRAVLAAVSKRPLVAIGGVKLHHLDELRAAGAEHVAVVTALTSAADVAAATRQHVERWRKGIGRE